MESGRGVAVWSTAEWRASAVAWIDRRLAAAGIVRTGEVDQSRVRPWSTVLRVPTSAGTVWFKAAGAATAFEAGVVPLLARVVPDAVLAPTGTEPARGLLLFPDGGQTLGERAQGAELVDGLVAALAQYGRLQRAVAPHVGELLALGVPDMRPAVMPQRFAEALRVVGEVGKRAGRREAAVLLERVAPLAAIVEDWCERLAASPLPPSLDHNDLHPRNILGTGGADVRFYDWGDAVVAHPFAAMLVPLGFVQRRLGADLDDPRFVRARDAYLGVYADLAPREELADTLALACRVAKIARVLTWDRAVRSAREAGASVEDTWALATVQTLGAVADESYLSLG
jgi:hypothetical protein